MSRDPLELPPLTSRARRARIRARIDRAGVLVGALLLLPATVDAGGSEAARDIDDISHSSETSIGLAGSLLSVEALPAESLELRGEGGGAWREGSKPLPTQD